MGNTRDRERLEGKCCCKASTMFDAGSVDTSKTRPRWRASAYDLVVLLTPAAKA
jgi:hypothetical protein